jgi:putative thioredoxin
MAYLDVTDATFQAEVIERSATTPVVVDLWAEWCGPCRTLGPIIEQVIDDTAGQVLLAKIDVDSNPRSSQTFKVQSIPAVYAVKDRKIVDGFVGGQSEAFLREFVSRLLPAEGSAELQELLAAGDEPSLRHALELAPDEPAVLVALAELLVNDGRSAEALDLLGRVPETPEIRRVAALARLASDGTGATDVEGQLAALLPQVKDDDAARQHFVDLLEVLGADDPRTATWRRKLTNALF